MSYIKKYIESVGFCFMMLGGARLLFLVLAKDPEAIFGGFLALFMGAAGPLSLWIDSREKNVK